MIEHVLALCAGTVFGVLYMTLLWRAVNALTHQEPVRHFIFLALLRLLLLVLALFTLLALDTTATMIVTAVAGFILIRIITTHLIGSDTPHVMQWK